MHSELVEFSGQLGQDCRDRAGQGTMKSAMTSTNKEDNLVCFKLNPLGILPPLHGLCCPNKGCDEENKAAPRDKELLVGQLCSIDLGRLHGGATLRQDEKS